MRAVNILKNSLTIFIALLASLFLLELGVRAYSAFLFPKMMVLDDELGWKHAANLKKTFINEFGEKSLVVQNSHGHRGNYSDFTKDSKRYRVLALGDSFTEGVQVAENDLFSERLEGIKPHVEAINAGVGGYGTVQEYIYLRTEGLKFNPDAVLLMFFENDLSENCLSYYPGFGPRPYSSLIDGQAQIHTDMDPTEYLKFILPVPFRMTLNRGSYLYYFVNSHLYQKLRAGKMKQLLRDDMNRVEVDTKLQVFYSLVKDMRDLLRRQNIDFIIVLIPTREDIRQGEPETHRLISEFCKSNQVRYISLLDRFQKETASGKQLYFPIDIHWTRDGHSTAADEIAKSFPSGLSNP